MITDLENTPFSEKLKRLPLLGLSKRVLRHQNLEVPNWQKWIQGDTTVQLCPPPTATTVAPS